MKKFLLFFLLFAVTAAFAAEKIAVDFKSHMKWLKGVQRSEDVFVTQAPALAVDGREVKGKKHTVAGKHFYIFGNNARALAGKNLILRAKIKRISGIAPLSIGYRVFGNGNKFMSGRSISTKASQKGKWENLEMSFQVPPLSGIENVNVGFTLRQETPENNRIIVDDVKIYFAENSGLENIPGAGLGMAALLLNKGKLELIKNGVPRFKIVIPVKADAIARYAAEELRNHVKLMTDKNVPITTDNSCKETAIWIGDTALAQKYGVTPQMIPQENWVIARVGNAIILSGGDKPGVTRGNILSRATIALGTLSATYEFMERVLGCRWYWPGKLGTVVSSEKNIAVDNLYKTGAPQFDCRALFYDISKDPDIPPHAVVTWQRRNRLGGSAPDPIAMHSFRDWLEKFGKTHPEYFALQPDGKRKLNTESGIHLCMTNPDVIREAGKWAVEYFKKHPNAKFVSIMPGDSNDLKYCRCPNCSKMVSEEKGRAGIHSNAVWKFVNQVAAVVAEKCPGKLVKCCAYADYLRRPDFALLPNVAVTLCFGPVPRANIEYKKAWRELIEEWRVTGARLYVWEYWNSSRYGRGYYGAPALWPRQLKEIYLLDSSHVAGRVIELSDINADGVGVQSWADWMYDSVNLYMAMRLMWDRDVDVDAELKKFHKDFYGPAAAAMEEFNNALEIAWYNGQHTVKGKNVWDWEVCWTKAYPPKFVDRMMGLLRKAVKDAAGKEPYYSRAKKTLDCYKYFERNSKMFRGVQVKKAQKIEVPKGTAPKIDGVVNDAEWKNAAVISNFCDSYNVYQVKSKTMIKFRHDGKYLYAAVIADIPAANVNINKLPEKTGKRDAFLWDYESIEFFFGGKDDQSYQFILAPDNALFDATWGGKHNLNSAMKWNSANVKFATTCTKKRWTGEIAIPLADLKFANPVAKNTFRSNFARNHRYTDLQKSRRWEQSMWLPTFGGFHNMERYGTLVLK